MPRILYKLVTIIVSPTLASIDSVDIGILYTIVSIDIEPCFNKQQYVFKLLQSNKIVAFVSGKVAEPRRASVLS